jgi:hypothetical protein
MEAADAGVSECRRLASRSSLSLASSSAFSAAASASSERCRSNSSHLLVRRRLCASHDHHMSHSHSLPTDSISIHLPHVWSCVHPTFETHHSNARGACGCGCGCDGGCHCQLRRATPKTACNPPQHRNIKVKWMNARQ